MIRMVLRLGLALLVPCAGGTVPGRGPTAAPRCPRRRLPAKRRAGARAVPTHIGTTGRRVHTGIFACGATRFENFHLGTPRRGYPPLRGVAGLRTMQPGVRFDNMHALVFPLSQEVAHGKDSGGSAGEQSRRKRV